MLQAKIIEDGNGYPSAGAYVAASDGLYRIVSLGSTLLGPLPGGYGYVLGTVERADWSDCAPGAEFRARLELELEPEVRRG